ncbi:hypothetical protein DUZ99_11900 [Xylanibacillus composti]|uniref:Uncharacterized protein n=1 Tax=Xylanibacillus composti TaxID=1572762 RepID=A0A8J4M0S0_9BACL|nr:hypothetical protein [Xylanibacillus composti]MDT9725676.1 hypothetical protein [Xylanibacillus composti]GIQ67774.1 hypothetical protein XYCOK13_05980 [Xylanibacillus composti]
MRPETLAFVLIAIIIAASAIATVAIGFSRRNKEGNPDYDRRTKKNFTRLTLYYVVATILGFGGLAVYLYYFL